MWEKAVGGKTGVMRRQNKKQEILAVFRKNMDKKQQTRWRKLCLTGRTMRTVPGQHSPLTMAPMQHIHPCFWMACISVEFMPHFFLWEKISREKKKS